MDQDAQGHDRVLDPCLRGAQEVRVVRADTDLAEVIQMVGGIAKIPTSDPVQIEHILDIALDGLRSTHRAPGRSARFAQRRRAYIGFAGG